MNKIFYIFKRILPVINIPKHIKRYYLKWKISRHKDEDNESIHYLLKFINLVILAMILGGIIYLNIIYKDRRLIVGSIVAITVAAIGIFVKKNKKRNKVATGYQEVEALILKDESDQIIKRWKIHNSPSLLIGKKTKANEVDIDLSEAVYASLISRQHAVMNNTGDKWYFEDIGSSNGSGIKRKQSSEKIKIEQGRPYQVNAGDTIYIANTKLLVK
ncbi:MULTISPECIES: FHA domain-containing protein [unclassified Candidatus Frackibacter]|uniref:FHA domain-containing protein n=1 Tax=unclassified Candidatus Frackibacter TaxID=2648818 RepID=UPI0008855093|nr:MULTISPECIES: FHA domain-containing protein [unclassified Candidatus Frackibacter]SDC16402.1 Forkhead associated (FHA) domain, binds pSer, pThr, pTyr [Candidatus Frackibacter sp. WG11]SEM45320.1 Forkhead associated (FHA) domain, binds pSer, pThr, pTyr [Candidatus Frackibacter sp. WG12]SFL47628.1 Forkhead associated (FHA) domain, binds pSer, pThr, pTyr [Candidatus Frackibacter sp. WG13]